MSCPTAVLLKYPLQLMMVITLECKYALRIIALTKLGFLMVVIMLRSRSRMTETNLRPSQFQVLKKRGTMTVTKINFSLPLVARNPKLTSVYVSRSSPEPSALDSENILSEKFKFFAVTYITYNEILILWPLACFRHFL